jgi:hypothetical protein
MKRGQGKRWWDFESCTIKRREVDTDTRSLHRMIFSLIFLSDFFLYMFSRFLFQRASEAGAWRFRLGAL